MKRYLITGASRGIGRATARKLAAADVTLLLHGRDRDALHAVCTETQAAGAKTRMLIHDLTSDTGVAGLIEDAGDEALDLLVNNAGIAIVRPFAEVTMEEWHRSMAANVTAPFRLIQRFAPGMKPGASIVNILSIAAKNAFPNWSVYCASKFALDGLTSAIREELRPTGVRMINIYPAATDTDIWNAVGGDWPREQMMSANDIADAVVFAITRPALVAAENITLSNTAGAL